ncbi:MAG: aminodeoxychorismate synthase component I [Spirochaetes bacterium]|nr:aminodeoxychorismate synthase component I [Spirochaetota bacterium]
MKEVENYFSCFETNKIDRDNFLSYYFKNPVQILTIEKKDQVSDFFSKLEKLARDHFIFCFFSYELGYLFENRFKYKKLNSFPYAVACVYGKACIYDHLKDRFIQDSLALPQKQEYSIKNLRLNTNESEYRAAIHQIKHYIRQGDIYQANYTIKYKFDFFGSPFGLYLDLKNKQKVAFNVFARLGDYHILSISPELFFRKNKDSLRVKPMKGTMKRGMNCEEDDNNRLFLSQDKKNQSENLMIVDLLRNDLGKISCFKTVQVKDLFQIEQFNTLFQMTSTIQSRLYPGISPCRLLQSLFPSGSVTGAPKIRSMEIIQEMEKEGRGIYTGALGFFEPGGKALFNVAIRTIVIHDNKGEMGIGGGIVHDSVPEEEFQECKLKAKFLIDKALSFELIETLLFDKHYKYLDLHFKRLKQSAGYFDLKYSPSSLLKELNRIRPVLKNGKYKIRILLYRSGNFNIQYSRIKDAFHDHRITISSKRTDPADIYLYHKTTNRELYDSENRKAKKSGYFDAIFFNDREELTEGAICNVYMKKDGVYYTPPVKCGLLNGIIRQVMLKKHAIRERIITRQEFEKSDSIYISNSIIGFKKARLENKLPNPSPILYS